MKTKLSLLCSLVIYIFLCACEPWTLYNDLEKRIMAFENNCYRRLFHVHCTTLYTPKHAAGDC